MRKFLFFVFFLLSFFSHSQEFFYNKLPVSVEIEREKFFSFGIKDVYYDNDVFKVEFDYDRQKFVDAKTTLHIETDIPTSWNFPYSINIVDIFDSCHARSDPTLVYATDISEFYIDDIKLNKLDELSFKEFKNNKDFLYDFHKLDVKFKKLDPEIYAKSKCSGSMLINVGIDF